MKVKIPPPIGSKPPSHNINECEPKSAAQRNLDMKMKGVFVNEEIFDRFCSVVGFTITSLFILSILLFIGIIVCGF